MQQFAGDTGARFFEVSKRMPIDKVFAIIEEDLRNQYSLGYSPGAAFSWRLPPHPPHHETEGPDRANPRRLLPGVISVAGYTTSKFRGDIEVV